MRWPRILSLRAWFLIVIVTGLAGAFAVAVIAGLASWREQKERLDASLIATSHAISQSVQREIDQAVSLARGLSLSGSLAAGDFDGFDRESRKVLAQYGYQLILRDDGPYQRVNTQRALGSTEPPLRPVEPITREMRGGMITIPPISRSPVTGLWVVGVEVPILDADGSFRYVLTILLPSSVFQRIIDDQHLPPEWTSVLLDTDWTVVARDRELDKYIGKKGGAQEFQHAPQRDGVHEVRLLGGARAWSAHSHDAYGWTTAVAITQAAAAEQFLVPVLLAAGTGFAGAVLPLALVLLLVVRFARGIRTLADATGGLGEERAIELPDLPIRELAIVGEGLRRAAAKIAESRYGLEKRIAEVTAALHKESEERRASEAALAQSRRMESLGQLTGGIAHDFNNFLMVIAGNLDLIEAKTHSDDIRRLARFARRGVERGSRLVEILLAFARRQPLRPEIVNPNLLIKEFAPLLKKVGGDAVELQLLLSPTLYPCRIDPAQFQSAILNLVTNACAAMPSGGRITIQTENFEKASDDGAAPRNPGSYVRISVADTGSGMSREVLERVFEPFFTTKEVGKGTGLGLSQVYGLAKQAEGDVAITSEEGIGTTVYLFLRRSTDAASARPNPMTRLIEPVASAKTVMVVDDDPDVRSVMCESVRALGYQICEAADGQMALEIIASGRKPDLVLTDYLMPKGMTGVDLQRRLAATHPEIRVLLISGHGEQAADLLPGAFPILRKPIGIVELGQALRRALNSDPATEVPTAPTT